MANYTTASSMAVSTCKCLKVPLRVQSVLSDVAVGGKDVVADVVSKSNHAECVTTRGRAGGSIQAAASANNNNASKADHKNTKQ